MPFLCLETVRRLPSVGTSGLFAPSLFILWYNTGGIGQSLRTIAGISLCSYTSPQTDRQKDRHTEMQGYRQVVPLLLFLVVAQSSSDPARHQLTLHVGVARLSVCFVAVPSSPVQTASWSVCCGLALRQGLLHCGSGPANHAVFMLLIIQLAALSKARQPAGLPAGFHTCLFACWAYMGREGERERGKNARKTGFKEWNR